MKLRTLCAFILLPLATIAAESGFDIRNEAEFHKVVSPDARLEKLASGMSFSEGPVWADWLSSVVFSDIPHDELKIWNSTNGLKMFRKPSHNANGNTLASGNRLITCEHATRRVSVQKPGARVQTLVDSYHGHKLNSPNDVVVKSDGTVWFTDPSYGIDAKQRELPGNYVFRFEPKTKHLVAALTNFDMPNGLCFSPDESKLYVADSGAPRHIRVFNCSHDNQVDAGKVFCSIDKGLPDGIRCDRDGRVWSTSEDSIQIFSPGGELIGKILVPETPANLCFGGTNRDTLFITAQSSLYSIKVASQKRSVTALDPRRFEKQITEFEASDATNPPPQGGIVFVGSSSIRKWTSVAKDFPNCHVLNRGFGGSHLADSVYYADRIVIPYHPKAIVFFAGSNDINFGLSPEDVVASFKAFVEKVRTALPSTEIIYLSISTSPSRWTEFDRVRQTNRLIQDQIKNMRNVRYVDVVSAMLKNGTPNPDIYGPDRLHMNEKGYAIWTSILRPYVHCDEQNRFRRNSKVTLTFS
ncbi:MAG: Gluconolactonase [Verrucomicrobiales bacterium]|nr:Gluconolactonase [Verrucomicrobiales bacterium]